MPTPNVKHAPAAEPAPQQPTAESLGWQLRAALPPLRLHSVSLYDQAGEVLWLSEGALGPDEHGFVVDALSALTDDPSSGHRESDFDDGRAAVFLAIRSPQAELVGLVMILVDAKALSAGGLAARILVPPVRALLQRLAILLRPASAASATMPAALTAATPAISAAVPAARSVATPAAVPHAPSSGSGTSRTLEVLEWTPPEPELLASPVQGHADDVIAIGEVLAPHAIEEILTFDLTDNPQPAREPACELYAQELAKLRPGGRMRRFQLLPKQPLVLSPRSVGSGAGRADTNRAGNELVERTLTEPLRELAAWLGAHGAPEEGGSLSFSLAVPAAVLEIDDLPEMLAECVRSAPLAPGSIGFEIAESACVRERERAERFIHTLEQLGSFLVLDDFTFDSGALEVLRSKALRLVKVERTLIGAALRDKLAQARIVAISQAARVLGIHCAAKHVDALATQRWLAAAGFDFAEGPMFAGPKPLASLAGELADR